MNLTPVELDKETGELFVVLPAEIMEQMGWKAGDEVTWKLGDNKTAQITIRKQDEQ
jgi:antitoxin component of MazEF toxin-antitoxin module